MPTILTVDDDPEVLRVIERDLRRKYGDRFRVLKADSSIKALKLLNQLKLRNESVGLLLVDQRMPRMTGVEFLEQAMEIFPDAKRVLLTAYADTKAAIRAINIAKIDYYLLKPWDPLKRTFIPLLTICLRTGKLLSAHYLKAFASLTIGGLQPRIKSGISCPTILFPISGWTSRKMKRRAA